MSYHKYDKRAKSTLKTSGLNDDDFATVDFSGLDFQSRLEDMLTFAKVPAHPFTKTEEYQNGIATIKEAAEAGKSFGIFGDYDGDGTTSAAMFTTAVEEMGGTVGATYINDVQHGFGYHKDGLEQLRDCDVIVVMDSGTDIGDNDYVQELLDAGKTVVFVDHHPLRGNGAPEGSIVVNPAAQGFEKAFRTSSLAYQMTKDMLGDKLTVDQQREMDAIGAIGAYTDAAYSSDSDLHAKMCKAVGIRALYDKSVGLKAFFDEVCVGDSISTDDLSMAKFGLGTAKYDGEATEACDAYDLMRTKDPVVAKAKAKKVAGAARRISDALEEGVSLGILNGQQLPNGLVVSALDSSEYEPRYRGCSGLLAPGISKAWSTDGRAVPAFTFIDAGDGTYKGSYRVGQAFDGNKLMQSLIEKMPAEARLSGGGHPPAGGASIKKEYLPKFYELLGQVDLTEYK